jgi:hypothetical protein
MLRKCCENMNRDGCRVDGLVGGPRPWSQAAQNDNLGEEFADWLCWLSPPEMFHIEARVE